jgi:hypothetical protein
MVNPIFSSNMSSNDIHNIQSKKVTKNEAEKVFWKLGDQFWKQIIDFDCHKYGHEVFDKGLHGGSIEPGFYNSLVEGCQFATEHLTEQPTVRFYQDLNIRLCQHFKKLPQNGVQMEASEAGTFRETYSSSTFNTNQKEFYQKVNVEDCLFGKFEEFEKMIGEMELSWEGKGKKLIDIYIKRPFFEIIDNPNFSKEEKSWAREQMNIWVNKPKEEFLEGIKIKTLQACANLDAVENVYKEKLNEINRFINNVYSEIHEKVPTYITYVNSGRWTVQYSQIKPEDNERITGKLFDRYNEKINQINDQLDKAVNLEEITHLKDQKLNQIAELYQLLEWLHPFPDGQGRTDLVLLAKLLTDQGFTPAILETPYLSSTETPSLWKESLKEGIQRFAEYAS